MSRASTRKKKRADRLKKLNVRPLPATKPLRIDGPLRHACPSCQARPGQSCSNMRKRQYHARRKALLNFTSLKPVAKPKLLPIGPVLAPLVAATANNKPGGKAQAKKPHGSPAADCIDPKRIIIGTRYRKDFGDLKALARSIDERGGLIQPIALKPNRELIAGERRIKAWALSRFSGQPIPCHYLDIDAILKGEWDENDPRLRKSFTPGEAVKIKRALDEAQAKLEAQRAASERAAPGRKASGDAAGNTGDKAARVSGLKRSSLYKAEAVVKAAEENPELFGDLQEEMDRTNKVNAPYQKLQVRQARRKLLDAPPQLPMHGPYEVMAIDYPWPHEGEDDQETIDARDRSLRPYPAMAIAEGVKFMRDQVAPILAAKCVVPFWVPNHHLARGYHRPLIAALGLEGCESTILTWVKDKLGRGRVLRDKTEQCIIIVRGKALLDIYGKNPPTTELRAPRLENSRKPKKFYQLVERVFPAQRYAEIFSTGAHGRKSWDCHGDQVGKFAVAA